jgi:ABC-type phosphate/phosphonate transport system substrate-binding protein
LNKYKITDEEGIKLFLEQEETPKEEAPIEEPVNAFRLSKKKKTMLGLTLFVFLSVLLLSVLYVRSVRQENLYVNKLTAEFDSYLKYSDKNFTTMEEIDTLLTKTDDLIEAFRAAVEKYPSRSELKKNYGELVVRKNVINLEIEFSTYGDVSEVSMSEDDFRIVKQNNPGMLFLVDLFREIVPFVRFYNEYPLPPEAATVAPESWKIDSLFKYGGNITNILRANDIVLKEKFPGMYSTVKYIFNNLYPKAFAWKKFWDKYSIYTKSTDALERSGLLEDLQAQFPKLTMIGNNSLDGVSGVNNVVIGVSSTAVLPVGNTTMSAEWKPVLQFLEQNCGVKFQLKVYNNEEDLYEAYNNGTVGLAVFNNIISDRLYSSGTGRPILIRTWSKKNYVNIVAVSTNRSYKDIFSTRGARAAFSKNAYLAPFLSLYKSGIEPETYFSKLRYADMSFSAIDSVVRGKSDVAFVTEEVAYYYKYANPNVNLIENFSVGTEPLSLMWCRDNVSQDIISNIQSILRTADPTVIFSSSSFTMHPYGDWSAVDQNKLRSMFQGFNSETLSKVNKIFLMPLKVYGNLDRNRLKSELISNLTKRGYEVVDVDNLRLSQNAIGSLSKVALYCQVNQRKGVNDYTFTCVRENSGRKQHLFTNRISARSYPPNLFRLTFEVTMHVPLYMTVVKVENGTAQLRMPASIIVEAGKEVRFVKVRNTKSNFLGEQELVTAGKGKVLSDNGGLITVQITEQNKNKISSGDYAEVLH